MRNIQKGETSSGPAIWKTVLLIVVIQYVFWWKCFGWRKAYIVKRNPFCILQYDICHSRLWILYHTGNVQIRYPTPLIFVPPQIPVGTGWYQPIPDSYCLQYYVCHNKRVIFSKHPTVQWILRSIFPWSISEQSSKATLGAKCVLNQPDVTITFPIKNYR